MAATTLLRERQTRDGIRTFSSQTPAGTHTFGGSDSRTTVCTTTTFVHHESHYFGRSGLRSWREKGASVGIPVQLSECNIWFCLLSFFPEIDGEAHIHTFSFSH